jgi:hypothetical protein
MVVGFCEWGNLVSTRIGALTPLYGLRADLRHDLHTYGQHHPGGGDVGDPHRDGRRRQHKPQQELTGLCADNTQDQQRHTPVQAPSQKGLCQGRTAQ